MPTAAAFPPFPDYIPTHPLLIIDYALLQQKDEREIERLWEAAKQLGFWYLKNHGADEFVDGMFDLGAETMSLPMEEKMKFEQGDDGVTFGYKVAGANAVDATGQLDTVEFLNVAKDDALAYPTIARRAYPNPVNLRMYSTIVPFIRRSIEVNETILEIFNDKLGLPKGRLGQLHEREEWSGSEARITRKAPVPVLADEAEAERLQQAVAIGSHTDFGSLSFLHNRLGGLQVLAPASNSWQYVKPLPGHAICNIGDALAIFSAGILRSNLHRVLPPPGTQVNLERWSLVYFMRPGNNILLRALVEESPIIAEEAARSSGGEGNMKGDKWNPGQTAQEWFERRVRNQRIKNRKGPETWTASRGTERVEA